MQAAVSAVPHAVEGLDIPAGVVARDQILAGAKENHQVRLIALRYHSAMANHFRPHGNRLVGLARKKRATMDHRPVVLVVTAQVKSPQVALQVAGIDPVRNLITIGVDHRWRRQAIALGWRPRAGGDAQVILFFGPLAIQATIEVQHEQFRLAGGRRDHRSVLVTIAENGSPTPIRQQRHGGPCQRVTEVLIVTAVELPQHQIAGVAFLELTGIGDIKRKQAASTRALDTHQHAAPTLRA